MFSILCTLRLLLGGDLLPAMGILDEIPNPWLVVKTARVNYSKGGQKQPVRATEELNVAF
jgi:hypothetical protein